MYISRRTGWKKAATEGNRANRPFLSPLPHRRILQTLGRNSCEELGTAHVQTHTSAHLCRHWRRKNPLLISRLAHGLGSGVVSLWGLARGANICCFCGLGFVTILILCLLNLPHSARAPAHKTL